MQDEVEQYKSMTISALCVIARRIWLCAMGHNAGFCLRYGPQQWATALGHSYGPQLWATAMGHSYGPQLWATGHYTGFTTEQNYPTIFVKLAISF